MSSDIANANVMQRRAEKQHAAYMTALANRLRTAGAQIAEMQRSKVAAFRLAKTQVQSATKDEMHALDAQLHHAGLLFAGLSSAEHVRDAKAAQGAAHAAALVLLQSFNATVVLVVYFCAYHAMPVMVCIYWRARARALSLSHTHFFIDMHFMLFCTPDSDTNTEQGAGGRQGGEPGIRRGPRLQPLPGSAP